MLDLPPSQQNHLKVFILCVLEFIRLVYCTVRNIIIWIQLYKHFHWFKNLFKLTSCLIWPIRFDVTSNLIGQIKQLVNFNKLLTLTIVNATGSWTAFTLFAKYVFVDQVPDRDQLLAMETVTAARCGEQTQIIACLCTTAFKLYSRVEGHWICIATDTHKSVVCPSPSYLLVVPCQSVPCIF